ASVGLGIAGAGMSMAVGDGELPFPGESGPSRLAARAQNRLQQLGLAVHNYESDADRALQDESPASVSFRSTAATIYGHEWADADGSIKDEKAANNDKIAAAMRSGKTAVGNSQTPSIPDPDKMARELSDKILEDAGAASHGKSMNYIKRAEGDP